jgi:hypothetical protein
MIIIIVMILAMILSSMITLSGAWKYYKITYNKLPFLTPYLNHDMVCFQEKKHSENDIIWFSDKNDFKISSNKYLHGFFITYFDPVSLYWLIKYRKWVKKNIDLDKIIKI